MVKPPFEFEIDPSRIGRAINRARWLEIHRYLRNARNAVYAEMTRRGNEALNNFWGDVNNCQKP